MKWLLPLVALLSAPAVALAQSAVKPAAPVIEEFFRAHRVSIEERGDLEISMDADRDARMPWASSLDLEYGLTRRLQIQAELPVRSGDGEREGSVGFTAALLTGRTSLSAGLNADLGTARREAMRGASRLEPFFAASRSLGPAVLQIDGAYGRSRLHPLVWNVAAVYPWRALRAIAEVNHGDSEPSGSFVITPGVVWKAPYAVEIGAGVPITVHSPERTRGVSLRLTRSFDF